jgi:hypothetical protein
MAGLGHIRGDGKYIVATWGPAGISIRFHPGPWTTPSNYAFSCILNQATQTVTVNAGVIRIYGHGTVHLAADTVALAGDTVWIWVQWDIDDVGSAYIDSAATEPEAGDDSTIMWPLAKYTLEDTGLWSDPPLICHDGYINIATPL